MNISTPLSASEIPAFSKIATGEPKNRRETPSRSSDILFNARAIQESYTSTSLSFEYTSKDGDTVSLSMQSVEYSKSLLEVSSGGNKEDMEKLVEYIKNNMEKLQKNLLKTLLSDESGSSDPAEAAQGTQKPIEVPEYWSAESTSQRIIDFSISFYSSFEGAGEEFLSTIRSAIDEGFKQAREMMGELPEGVTSLIDDTYSLTMQKLDSWATSQNIGVPKSVDVQV